MLSFLWIALILACATHAHTAPPSNKRYIDLQHPAHTFKAAPADHANFKKRYVLPNANSAHVHVDISHLRRKSIFATSTLRQSLTRSVGRSADLVQRGLLHPLLYHTQHLNRALSRRSSLVSGGDLTKRDALKRDHAREAEDRMRRRWEQLHEERGMEAPALVKGKRGYLQPASTKTKRAAGMFGINGKLAQDAARTLRAAGVNALNATTAAEEAGAGFDKTKLAKALSNDVTKANGKITTDNTEGLAIEANDIGYFGNLQLGTPGTNFKILFDTGSADFWVPSQQCNDDGDCGGHQTLGTKSSQSFVASNKGFQVTYGTGAVQGVLVKDTVALFDGSLSLPNHTFGVNTDETDDFADPSVAFDGLMGMALSSLSNQQVPTYIEALATNGLLANAQMGYNLASVADPVQDSEITFGGINTDKLGADGLTEFKNVDKSGFWTGAMQSVAVDGKKVKIAAKTAILDTGTTLIIAPQADADAFHAAIPGAASDGNGGFTVPCTTSAEIAFTFGGKQFVMNPSDLAFVPVSQDDLTGACVSAMSAGDIDNQGSWLLGDAFLKSMYFATDVTTNTMGLSQTFVASKKTVAEAAVTAVAPKKAKKTPKARRGLPAGHRRMVKQRL